MKCLNCDTEFEGNFCPECGQSAKTDRFTMKFILQNLTTAILGRDGGVWFTLKNLFTRPASMIVDILGGKRKKYFSPFPMLFFALTLYILITSFTSGFVLKDTLEHELLEDPDFFNEAEHNPKTIAFMHLVHKGIVFFSNHYTLCYLLTLPLLVVAARACFGKSNRKRYYWAEYIIAVVYASVILVLFRCLVKLIYPFAPDLSMEIGLLVAPLVIIPALTACFRKMTGFSIAKTAWRSILTYLLYDLILFGLAIIGIIIIAIVLDDNIPLSMDIDIG